MAERLSEEQIVGYSARITGMIEFLEQDIAPVEQPKGWKVLIVREDPTLRELQKLPTRMLIMALNNFRLGMLAAVGQIDVESYLRLKEVDVRIAEAARKLEG